MGLEGLGGLVLQGARRHARRSAREMPGAQGAFLRQGARAPAHARVCARGSCANADALAGVGLGSEVAQRTLAVGEPLQLAERTRAGELRVLPDVPPGVLALRDGAQGAPDDDGRLKPVRPAAFARATASRPATRSVAVAF